jgi:hypothetical protein
MRSRQLEQALRDYVEAAAGHLREELAGGAEVPFEVGASGAGGGHRPTLYCYRALTAPFIAERSETLKALPGHAESITALEGHAGLECYLAARGRDGQKGQRAARAQDALYALLEEVFDQQVDFQVDPARLQAALERLQEPPSQSDTDTVLVATLHGLTIASPEVPIAGDLKLVLPDVLDGLPPGVATGGAGDPDAAGVVVVHRAPGDDPAGPVAHGREVLRELLRALRLFGDGRIALGTIGWSRTGAGPWSPLPLGRGGRPHGVLLLSAEEEDELRAFCKLVSRRAPTEGEVAWALRRYELGCDREDPLEALTDHLGALRALLEPEGPASGLLAGRLAVLCAAPAHRARLAERVAQGIALERALVTGASLKSAGAPRNRAAARALADELGDHLRALLSDVLGGHLDQDLAGLADRLLEETLEAAGAGVPTAEATSAAGTAVAESTVAV